MDTAGQKLKRARERLQLRYRDVEQASQQLAERLGNPEYAIALSRLSDIENKGTVPTIFRLYSLCAIYRLALTDVLGWYGVRTEELVGNILHIPLDSSHVLRFSPDAGFPNGHAADSSQEADPDRTHFLGKRLQWGRLSSSLLAGFDFKFHRLGFIGEQDWFMYPILPPGSVVIIDERERKIATGGWTSEADRPIYFLEHREGYSCGWVAVQDEFLIAQPHPASPCSPVVHRYPNEVEVIGRVVGTCAWLTQKTRPRARNGAVQSGFRDR